MKSDKLFFDSIRYRYDIRVFFSIRYEFSALLLLLLLLRTVVHEFSEFSGKFLNFRIIFDEKRQKITGFENIEILDMGGSIRYTLRYAEKSDISAFDKFSIR